MTLRFDELRFAEARPDTLVYSLRDRPDFRLYLPSDLPEDLAHNLPARSEYGRWIDRLGLGRATIAFGVFSAIALTLFLTAPDRLGPHIPTSWERKMGDAMIGDLGNRLCHTPAGDAALARLVTRIDPQADKVRAGVANSDIVNAAALPGGQVLLFDGLVQQANSPEELAGVLAHEVGHVRSRHVMTAILRQFGLSILLAGADSGLASNAVGIAAMGYSREAEREADSFARRQMARQQISPLGVASFFDRMERKYGDSEQMPAVVGWLASHPSSAERAKAYRASAKRGNAYRPPLSKAEFDAIKAMCKDDPDVASFDLL